jgi:hypothetical protein
MLLFDFDWKNSGRLLNIPALIDASQAKNKYAFEVK